MRSGAAPFFARTRPRVRTMRMDGPQMRFSDDSPDLARLADSTSPAFLFDHRGALVWANAAAAVYWGTPRRSALLATDFTRHAVAEQARTLVRSLAEGASRLERLRLVPFGRTSPLVAQVKRLSAGNGESAVLVTGLERVAEARVAALRASEAAAAPPAPVPVTPQAAPATQETSQQPETALGEMPEPSPATSAVVESVPEVASPPEAQVGPSETA